jgi:Spy/CpxP family protein refolding chaperone
MSSRLTQLLLGLSLLLNCFVLIGFVYRSWIEPPPPPAHMRPPSRGGPLEMLSEDLHLDAAQRGALHDVFEKYADARHERFREMRKVREAMVAELGKPEFDTPKIESLVDEISKLRTEQQKATLASIVELASRLSPEQRERLHKILVDRFGNPGGRQHHGRPRPPEPSRFPR